MPLRASTAVACYEYVPALPFQVSDVMTEAIAAATPESICMPNMSIARATVFCTGMCCLPGTAGIPG